MATVPIILMIRGTEEYSRRKFGQMRRPAAVLSKSGGNKSQICLPPSLPEFVKSSFDGRYIQTSQIHLFFKRYSSQAVSLKQKSVSSRDNLQAGGCIHLPQSLLPRGIKERRNERQKGSTTQKRVNTHLMLCERPKC